MQAGGLQSAREILQGLQVAERELMVFALFWFVIGAIDELAVDLVWFWLRLTGRSTTPHLPRTLEPGAIEGRIAVFIAAWSEAEVIGATVAHTLSAWPQPELRLYVGCYANDPATLAAAKAGADGDERIRLVVLDRAGPTTKADCLNRLYVALGEDEARSGIRYRGVILHDAEDMVHPAGLDLIVGGLAEADFVQLPVRPEPQPGSRWVGGHYGDEFIESHAKGLVVRGALGAAIPAAGVGCGFGRDILDALADLRGATGGSGPFAAECLTEDYELGWLIARLGGRSRYLRVRDADGELVATRAYFPSTITAAVRQKTRWIHGIAFQSWDRLGWSRRPVDIWMALRDRRGPLTALVMTAAYTLLVIETILAVARAAGHQAFLPPSPFMLMAVRLSMAALVWRIVMRVAFTAREYGWVEGARAVFRIPVANIIAIMASRRAISAYLRTLRGQAIVWDKTAHKLHPTLGDQQEQGA